ncbi:Fc.00g017460.m01.CDS01 [Cosmosporella sp. VM-42]
MGWLWSSSPAPKAPEAVAKEPAPPSSSPSSTAPNEPVDPEIQKFFDLFQTDKSQKPEPPSEPSPKPSSSSSSEKSTLSSWLSLKSSPSSAAKRTVTEAPPGDALSEALLPDDMSCRQAFDQAWACNSMGGQWNAVYRYGEMRSCSEQWDDFWFCMRTKSYSGEMREKAIRAHYRNKEFAKYGAGKPSSEDVWESREEKVTPGSVFTEKIE